MAAAALITLREGLEAALIIGVVLGVLGRLGQSERRRAVWAGVAAAVVFSIVAGLALNALGIVFEGRGEEIFEGVAMLLAAGVLTWMIFWMRRQGRQVRSDLEAEVRRVTAAGSVWALFSLAFVAVVREGVETVLFLTAAGFSASPTQTLVGGGLGLGVAILLGVLLFAAGRELDVGAFFRATGALLILFAAGLVAHGVHELQEAAIVPTLVEHVWDVNHIVDESSAIGTVLKALFGYNGNPSVIEVSVYVAYLIGVAATVWVVSRPRDVGRDQDHATKALADGASIGSEG